MAAVQKKPTSPTPPVHNLTQQQLDLLKVVLEQNWLHARHVEDERISFTNIYVLIVTGVLALGRFEVNYPRILFIFMFLLSVLGLIVTIKLSREFRNHIEKVERIVEDPSVNLRDYMGFPMNTGVWKVLRVRYAFMTFYVLMSVFWIVAWVAPNLLTPIFPHAFDP